ncbi:unnamed protein product, partial [Brassica rapa subsp. trilocularis]
VCIVIHVCVRDPVGESSVSVRSFASSKRSSLENHKIKCLCFFFFETPSVFVYLFLIFVCFSFDFLFFFFMLRLPLFFYSLS